MDRSGSTLERSMTAALTVLREIPTGHADYRALSESDLLSFVALNAEAARLVAAHGAVLAGEVARRSAPELGSLGLAQKLGHRTPANLITVTTGASRRHATTAVTVGTLMADTATAGQVDPVTGEVAVAERPWLAAVSRAVAEGGVSTEMAGAIRAGVGLPDAAVNAVQLAELVVELVGVARVRADGSAGMDVDRLGKFARMRREELDLAAVRVREDEQYAMRGIRVFELPSGMGRLVWDMDPETFILVKQAFDRAVSPKLGTVRFFDPTEQAKADTILADDRTPAQTASDAFSRLLLLGADTNPDFLLGSGAPQIRVTTTLQAITDGDGAVRVEGYAHLFSMRSLKRLHCSGGVRVLVFDEHLHPLDVGREQRLFTPSQRTALAVKWGGCVMPGCDAPVSWCEAHHITPWAKEHGKTDIADGILLCKHHHLLTHNTGWRIRRDPHGNYWITPPPGIDPHQTPRLLKPKARNMHDLATGRARFGSNPSRSSAAPSGARSPVTNR